VKLLEGKTAIITGAARGIGRAVAITFAKHGAAVAFTDMAIDDNAKSLEKELADLGVKGKGYASDASNFATIHRRL
jgi:3-oxoacyl-[acyl-carrier protein] reductase